MPALPFLVSEEIGVIRGLSVDGLRQLGALHLFLDEMYFLVSVVGRKIQLITNNT